MVHRRFREMRDRQRRSDRAPIVRFPSETCAHGPRPFANAPGTMIIDGRKTLRPQGRRRSGSDNQRARRAADGSLRTRLRVEDITVARAEDQDPVSRALTVTGLPNRTLFGELCSIRSMPRNVRIPGAVRSSTRPSRSSTTVGQAGHALPEVAARLTRCIRNLMSLPAREARVRRIAETDSRSRRSRNGERVLRALHRRSRSRQECASRRIGIAAIDDERDAATLMKHADMAMAAPREAEHFQFTQRTDPDVGLRTSSSSTAGPGLRGAVLAAVSNESRHVRRIRGSKRVAWWNHDRARCRPRVIPWPRIPSHRRDRKVGNAHGLRRTWPGKTRPA